MSTKKKFREKLYKKPIPNDIRIDDLLTYAKSVGCEVRTGGNHQYRIVHAPSCTVIPIPCHGDVVAEAYIKQFKSLLELIETEK